MTDDQLRDGVHQALCRFIHEQPPTCQIDSNTALIRAVYASTGPPTTVCPAPDARSTRKAGRSGGNAAQNPAY